MKRLIILFFVMSLSLVAQTIDNTEAELEKARARVTEAKKAEAKVKAEAKAKVKAEKEVEKKVKAEAKAKTKAEKEAEAKVKAEAKAKANEERIAKNEARELAGYNFWGRNAIGLNLAPIYQIAFFKACAKDNNMIPGLVVKNKSELSGVGASYEHKLVSFATFAGDYSYGRWGVVANYNDVTSLVDSSIVNNAPLVAEIKEKLGDIDLDFRTHAWAVGVKFYTGKKAPFGFFLYPKIGGTIVNMKGYYPTYDGKQLNETGIIDHSKIGVDSFNKKNHGVYTSVEIGWRIPLFPKRTAKSRAQVAIDISLLDLGYYFVPWTGAFLDEMGWIAGDKLGEYTKYINTRIVVLPRFGITVKF